MIFDKVEYLAKMKIVHICLAGLYMNGWGYQENMLAKFQKKDGHDVFVIANEYTYDYEGNYTKLRDYEVEGLENKIDNNTNNYNNAFINAKVDCNGVKIIRLQIKGEKNITGPAQRVHYIGLYEELEKMTPDIIFLHNPQILDVKDIVCFMKKNCRSVRLFVDSHSDYSNSARNFLSKHILHGMIWRNKVKKLIPYTTKFYGVLPARVDFLRERYHIPKNRIELLQMGMDDDLAKEAGNKKNISLIRSMLRVKDNDFLIVTGGKIDGAKKQTLLLMDAVKKINYPFLKLVIFGSVADCLRDEFVSKCDNERIQYVGWIDSNTTYSYFAASDFVFFPGRHSVMWEQVAGQGIPMAVKYWEGTTHIDIGGNVKFLREDSVEEIKKVIKSLFIEEEIKKMKCCNMIQKENILSDDYKMMKQIAQDRGEKVFSYANISKKSILCDF